MLLGRVVVAEASWLWILLRCPQDGRALPAHPLPVLHLTPHSPPHHSRSRKAHPQSSSNLPSCLTRKKQNQNSSGIQPHWERVNGALEGSSGGSQDQDLWIGVLEVPEKDQLHLSTRVQGPGGGQRCRGRGASIRGPVQKLDARVCRETQMSTVG